MRQRSAPVSRRAPQHSHHRSRPVSGLVGSGVSPSRELALPVAEARGGRKAPPRVAGWYARATYRCGGSRGLGRTRDPGLRRGEPLLSRRSESPSAPLSRFTPARDTRRDTSNERVDCTTQVAGLRFVAALGIYIENESLHLDLTGFSKL